MESNTEKLQRIFDEIAVSIETVDNDAIKRSKEASASLLALLSLLEDKGLINLNDFEKKKNEYRKKIDNE